jgi:hypothetical protein
MASVVVLVIVVMCSKAMAFKLSPSGTALERAVADRYSNYWEGAMRYVASKGVEHFIEPVHEEITHRIFDCEGEPDVCGNPDIGWASPYLLAGVRWNDDPPFRLEEGEAQGTPCKINETIRFTTQPKCWVALFKDAEKRAKEQKPLNAESRASLLARSHFGDLQFLHAMAGADNERTQDTKRRVMMWAEFTWLTSIGEYKLEKRLKEVPIEGMSKLFGRTEWRVQDLFTLGNVPLRSRIREVAFGSLLHMVEDSFAKGHVEREEAVQGETCPGAAQIQMPGRIKEFHSYANQDTGEHGKYDSRSAFSQHWISEKPNVVSVGRALREFYERQAPWKTVRPYIDCIFTVIDPDHLASPGLGFRSEVNIREDQ